MWVKLMNEMLDEIRRIQYHMEKDINKRKVLKGTRYLLQSNGVDIFDKEYKTRLDNALAMNKPLSPGILPERTAQGNLDASQ